MANTWPSADSFPQKPLMNGAGWSDQSGCVIRTEMDVGPAKMRQRTSSGYEPHSYSFMMTSTNVAAMKVFYNTTTGHGSETFEWTHPVTAATEEWRITAPPSYRPVSGSKYICSVQMEMMP